VYKVLVSAEGNTWFIFRRYNEFHQLYDKMKKLYPEAGLKLPGKKLFGSFDPDFIRHRREGLHDFIQKLLVHPQMSQNTEVRTFLNLDDARREPGGVTGLADAVETMDIDDKEGADHGAVTLGDTENKSARPSDFDFVKVIGKGSFGKVILSKHKSDGKVYAVKVLQKAHILKRNEAKHIMSERNVLLNGVKHPFLVGLHFSFQTKDKLYFVLTYVNGGELFFHLQRERCFPEPRARFYAAEIASALGYLHSLNIIYRDLKPENILLDSQGHVCLTDFGLCKENIKDLGTTSTFCGTPEYLAPEVLRKQPYDRTVDWWCMGAVLYEMLYGLPPFYSRDTSEMYDHILHKPLKLRGSISAPAKNILEGMLQKDKSMRLGVQNDFQDIKNHPFFASINWTHLDEKRIKPPYNPNVSGPMDLKHFDNEFTREPVPASVGKTPGGMVSASVAEADMAFEGFSYVPAPQDAFDF